MLDLKNIIFSILFIFIFLVFVFIAGQYVIKNLFSRFVVCLNESKASMEDVVGNVTNTLRENNELLLHFLDDASRRNREEYLQAIASATQAICHEVTSNSRGGVEEIRGNLDGVWYDLNSLKNQVDQIAESAEGTADVLRKIHYLLEQLVKKLPDQITQVHATPAENPRA